MAVATGTVESSKQHAQIEYHLQHASVSAQVVICALVDHPLRRCLFNCCDIVRTYEVASSAAGSSAVDRLHSLC